MPHHPSLQHAPSNLVAGRWLNLPGDKLTSLNPARPQTPVWSGSPQPDHVDSAVAAARAAQPAWAAMGLDARAKVLRRFQALAEQRVEPLATLIRDEVGKVMWDARAEASLLANKVAITLDPGPEGTLRRVTGYDLALSPSRVGRCAFHPHGVLAVLGPFNFPAHLPNGHIVPALAMGNTVVLKPSDKAPGVGQFLAELFDEALRTENAPLGVLNLVQGGADIASTLAAHEHIDGVLFTGSWPVGRRILEANLDRPGRILALEMGGNNPAIILEDADLRQAVVECVRSAFITTGQRCTCTRRLIIHESIAAKVIPAICKAASSLIIGDPQAEHPVFMGPLISSAAREHVVSQVNALTRTGGQTLVQLEGIDGPTNGFYVTPGVMRVDRFVRSTSSADPGADIEVFGPFLRICVVKSLDDAIDQANATNFGLAASIFTKDERAIARFLRSCRAGCLNVNTGTAGASSKLPFGGLGHSGNHRPAGAFSLDYCAYSVGCMIEKSDAATLPAGMKFDLAWIA